MTSPAPISPRPNDAPDPALTVEHTPWPEEVPLGEMTFAEYLAFAESAEGRHEYVDGRVYAMSYGTDDHGAIATNLVAIFRLAGRRVGCRTYSSAVRVLTPRGNSYVPDVMVDCGPRPPGTSLYREQPCLLVEVLSPSTRKIDFREKWEHYRDIETLQAYWIVEATWRCVHRHWRDADGAWQFEQVTGDGALPVPCLGGALTLDDVYEDIEVPAESPRPPLRRVREPDAAYVVDAPDAAAPAAAG